MPQKSPPTVINALVVAYLPQIIERFLMVMEPKGWHPTRLGKEALKDPNRIFQIRAGMQVRPATARKIIAVIDGELTGFCERTAKRLARENVYED